MQKRLLKIWGPTIQPNQRRHKSNFGQKEAEVLVESTQRSLLQCGVHEMSLGNGYQYFMFGDSDQEQMVWKPNGMVGKAKDIYCSYKEINEREKLRARKRRRNRRRKLRRHQSRASISNEIADSSSSGGGSRTNIDDAANRLLNNLSEGIVPDFLPSPNNKVNIKHGLSKRRGRKKKKHRNRKKHGVRNKKRRKKQSKCKKDKEEKFKQFMYGHKTILPNASMPPWSRLRN